MPASRLDLSVPAASTPEPTAVDATAPAWLLVGAAFCAAAAVLLTLTLF